MCGGREAEAAHLAALLELIERDATGIWWYGRCRRPGLDPARLGEPALHAAIEARTQGGQTVHLLNLTHDLRVPVVAAILFRDEQLLGLGFGCKLDSGGGGGLGVSRALPDGVVDRDRRATRER